MIRRASCVKHRLLLIQSFVKINIRIFEYFKHIRIKQARVLILSAARFKSKLTI